MDDKKSLREARERAREHSLRCPVKCYVMDKKGKRAKFYTLSYFIKELILYGWHVDAVYEKGVEVEYRVEDLLKR